MLLGLDQVSPVHNFLASLCVWILLAGYIVFPATFTTLQNEEVEDEEDNRIKAAALKTVRNVPLLYVASFACAIGVIGCLWLWWKHRKNYVWVINRIFLPALLNSIAGLISTIVNVYSAQDGTLDKRNCSRW
jgi:cytochrome bd-type quinol oxidase subunit 2